MTAAARRACLVVQHVGPEGPAAVGTALEEAGVALALCRLHAGDALPAGLARYGGLVVMGGPMSAMSDAGFPTRRAELALLEAALAEALPVLGVCLGAQLLALAGGGTVRAGTAGPEIGWGTAVLSPDAADDPLFGDLPATLEVLHWHGDTFDLGPGGVLLASSDRYRSQAFRAGPAAWGLQFHLEVDRRAAAAMAEAFPDDAAVAPGGAGPIVSSAPEAVMGSGRPGETVLARFAALVATGRAGGGGALD
ncbi:MAG: type 1 glutamine amidotransferase [Acidobacteriota bacterium]|nr:type 1 glutamine amidotransferase [Acidobacteriota bacterium]